MFFTQSSYDVTVTSPGHVTDLHVYTAPSVGRRDHNNVMISCRLSSVYDGSDDVRMKSADWPFTTTTSSSNTVSLYLRPRDFSSRDQGLISFTSLTA